MTFCTLDQKKKRVDSEEPTLSSLIAAELLLGREQGVVSEPTANGRVAEELVHRQLAQTAEIEHHITVETAAARVGGRGVLGVEQDEAGLEQRVQVIDLAVGGLIQDHVPVTGDDTNEVLAELAGENGALLVTDLTRNGRTTAHRLEVHHHHGELGAGDGVLEVETVGRTQVGNALNVGDIVVGDGLADHLEPGMDEEAHCLVAGVGHRAITGVTRIVARHLGDEVGADFTAEDDVVTAHDLLIAVPEKDSLGAIAELEVELAEHDRTGVVGRGRVAQHLLDDGQDDLGIGKLTTTAAAALAPALTLVAATGPLEQAVQVGAGVEALETVALQRRQVEVDEGVGVRINNTVLFEPFVVQPGLFDELSNFVVAQELVAGDMNVADDLDEIYYLLDGLLAAAILVLRHNGTP